MADQDDKLKQRARELAQAIDIELWGTSGSKGYFVAERIMPIILAALADVRRETLEEAYLQWRRLSRG